MTKYQIIQMAREAGAHLYADTICLDGKDIHDFSERFASAIRAATKEEDARICEELRDGWLKGLGRYEFMGEGADYCSDAIRASK